MAPHCFAMPSPEPVEGVTDECECHCPPLREGGWSQQWLWEIVLAALCIPRPLAAGALQSIEWHLGPSALWCFFA
ncbi:MAG: hypothetical protein J6U34_06810, partial [Bacteroidales bacterium]|nr:hypothetical protein [Bacteroidales bacterium]